MYKISKEDLLNLLKFAHNQGTQLCNTDHDLEDDEEELDNLKELIEDWVSGNLEKFGE